MGSTSCFFSMLFHRRAYTLMLRLFNRSNRGIDDMGTGVGIPSMLSVFSKGV